MLSVNNISLSFGKRTLFKEINLNFQHGNCYGVIGANGSGKSTFLKILSGEIESDSGSVSVGPNERIAVLKQDHFAFEECVVLDTVFMGHAELYEILQKRTELYSKAEMSEEDGALAIELETRFADLDGYEVESTAGSLLNGIGIPVEMHGLQMKELDGNQKVRVLLAQALFASPEILLLDEPTNHLDIQTVNWLEDYLSRYQHTVIVVSHDRHFLNQVCTHICDIDYSSLKIYAGNYDFWYEASQLAAQQRKNQNARTEQKMEELKSFIARFSSNASKAKQATSRKKLLDKMTLDDMPASSRKFPWIQFQAEREPGKIILELENCTIDAGETGKIKDLKFSLGPKDKVILAGPHELLKTQFFKTLTEESLPTQGECKWGQTISWSYLPKSPDAFFDTDLNLVDWLRQYSVEKDEKFIRSFLGRMLFSGDEALKKASVLSGGEKVRCMLSRMMLANANVLLLDEPTSHLDLESITVLNRALENFDGAVVFATQDHQFAQTVANRVLELYPGGYNDKVMTFDEWLYSK